MSIVEWAIIGFITVSIGWHVWRGGAANPESTGEIGQRVGRLSLTMTKLDGRVGQVEEKIDKLERDGATTEDIANLEKLIVERLNTVRAEMASQKELSAATSRNVQRIYDIMLERGLSGK